MRFSFSNFKPGLWWLQWVAILIAVGLFAGFSLLITLLVPTAEHFWEKARGSTWGRRRWSGSTASPPRWRS